jgi:hypothetical protein
MKLSNYYNKPTSKKWLKFLFNLKIFLGSIAATSYIQNEKDLAFWILCVGGIIDLIVNTFGPDDTDPNALLNKTSKSFLLVFLLSFCFMFQTGCQLKRQSVSNSRIDSTWVNYKLTKLKVPGGSVQGKPLNLDSLRNALKIGVDSAGKTIYREMQPIYFNDTSESAMLKLWIDQFGNIQTECIAKDKLIDILTAEVNKLRRELKETVTKEPETPKWNMILISVLSTLLIISLLINFLKR